MQSMRFRLSALVLFFLPYTASLPSIPTGPSLEALALQNRITAAGKGDVVHIEKGRYVFSNVSLMISGKHDLVLDGSRGVTLVFYYGYGVSIADSSNCTFRDLVLDSFPPNYAQGTLENVNGTSFTAVFSDDFIPPDTTDPQSPFGRPSGVIKVAFWNPGTRRMIPIGNQFMAKSTPIKGAQSWEIWLKGPVRGALNPGSTLVTIFPREGITWDLFNSSQILSENITIHAGGNMGFHEGHGKGGNVYRKVRNP